MSTSRKKAVTSRSPGQTRELGRKLAKSLKKGDTVFLTGDLGSGKTTFVQGVFAGLGIREFARSASFILASEYETPAAKVYHLDLYRLAGGDIEGLGIEEYLYGGGICLVEWAEKIGGLKPSVEVRLEPAGGDVRRITILDNRKRK